MKLNIRALSCLLLLALHPLYARGGTGYTVMKFGDSEFVASNSTSASGNFFLLLTPNGPQVQSAALDGGPSLSIQSSNGNSVIGPFSMPAGASVTLRLAYSGPSSSTEEFSLLTESQLNHASGLSLIPNPASDLSNGSAGRGLLRSAVAAPNVSRGNQPIDFLVNLKVPALMNLSLFTLAGEKVYGAQAQGNMGTNNLVWNLSDNAGGQVASGLYLYYLRVVGADGTVETRTGKVLVLH